MHYGAHTPTPQRAGTQQTLPANCYAYHDPDRSARLSTTVVHALADAMGGDVTETEFSLYDAVDPDALDRLFAPQGDGTERAPGHVAFRVMGHEVTVYHNGHIVITPPAPPTHRAPSAALRSP